MLYTKVPPFQSVSGQKGFFVGQENMDRDSSGQPLCSIETSSLLEGDDGKKEYLIGESVGSSIILLEKNNISRFTHKKEI